MRTDGADSSARSTYIVSGSAPGPAVMCQSSRTSLPERTGAGTATRILVLSSGAPMSRPSGSADEAHEPHGFAAVVAPANDLGCPADPPQDPRRTTRAVHKRARTSYLQP